MQCHEFEERMHTLLDERRLPQSDARLLAHAEQCPDCRLNLRAWEVLSQNLDQASSHLPPGGFAQRVVSQLEVRPAEYGAPTRYRSWLLAGAAATAAAIGLLAVTIGQNRHRPKPAPPAIAAPDSPAENRALATSPVVDIGPDNKPVNAESLTQEQSLQASPAELSRADVDSLQQYSQAFQSLASQVPQAVERLDEVEEATPGLRPVRTSFSLAIGTIRRTIPPPRKAAPPPKPAKGDSSGLLTIGDQLV
ncbi:MAG TPA: hypothetical protein VMP01_15365 [Pirellulaceae bacterium]|nr:hypothetical protein [Pirellulaceae bacterium]